MIFLIGAAIRKTSRRDTHLKRVVGSNFQMRAVFDRMPVAFLDRAHVKRAEHSAHGGIARQRQQGINNMRAVAQQITGTVTAQFQHFANTASRDKPPRRRHIPQPPLMIDRQQRAGSGTRGHHLAGLRRMHRHRFFAMHRPHTSARRHHGQLGVRTRVRGDRHHVGPDFGEHL